MKARPGRIWDALRGSLWFVPCGLTVAAILLATLTVAIDEWLSGRPAGWLGSLYSGGPDGARALLATIAGSMITVAGVTFSITVVALTLASTQFGPRLLRNFMRDTLNQVVLGTFIATFVYCLLVLRTVRGFERDMFVPQVSVSIGLLLAILSLVVLIYFIHHVSMSIQADKVIAAVCAECDAAIDALFPKDSGEERNEADLSAEDQRKLDRVEREGRPIAASASGYVQAVDGDAILSLASEDDLIVYLRCRPGQFVIAGSTLMLAWPAARLSEEAERRAQNTFVLGRQRTPTQDIEFAINQLVEIAARALSPGVNDPFTAMACVDRLGVSLASLAQRRFPSAYRFDDQARLRVMVDGVTFAGVLDAAFNQVRQYAHNNVAVLIRMLETICTMAALARRPEDRAALLRHAEMIHAAGCQGIPEKHDRNDIEQRYQAARGMLAEQRAAPGLPRADL